MARHSIGFDLSKHLINMDIFLQRLFSLFMAQPDLYLLAAIGLLLLVILALTWIFHRQMSVRDERIKLLGEETAHLFEQQNLSLITTHKQTQELAQHGLQGLQGIITDRMAAMERQLLQDTNVLKLSLFERFDAQQKAVAEALADGRLNQQRESTELKQFTEAALNRHREGFEVLQREAIKNQQETLVTTLGSMAQQISESFKLSSDELGKRVDGLTKVTDGRLKEISGQVEKRLTEGFEKTTQTFSQVLQHLTRIDEAQKKITELSKNVVSLQEVLTDKRSRGAFGEVQLEGLVRNVMPEDSFQMQATLSNGRRVDCLLKLPDPTGNVSIDAKFPLESYQRLMDNDLPEAERKAASTQFRKDIRKHIVDISSKYLIPGETAEGAVMFLPAEAIFAEIHAHYPDLVDIAQRAKVWMVSPTTLMAVLTTARAVLKDDATRKQVHVIQDHLRRLSEDFGRFRKRMDNLARHIKQAHEDVDQVNVSASKIIGRFDKIDNVEVLEKPDD